MEEPGGRDALSLNRKLPEEFAANADLSDSSLSQFIHRPLPLLAMKEFANQLTSRRRRKTCPAKVMDDDQSLEYQSAHSSETGTSVLDDVIHLYVGRYMRNTPDILLHNLNKKFKACELNERLRCRREQQEARPPVRMTCGSCSWAHGDSLHFEPSTHSGSTQFFRFVGDAKRLLHHASTYVAPYVYVFGGITARGLSDGLWALNVCEGYWQNIHQSPVRPADSDPPAYNSRRRNQARIGEAQLNSTSLVLNSPNNLLTNHVPETRFSHTLNAYQDRELILFGGQRGPGELNDIWRFNTKDKTWLEYGKVGQQPPPRSSHSSAIWKDKLIIFGGASGLEMLNDLWTYDLVGLCWTELKCCDAVKPEGRSGHTCGISEDTLFVFGGSSSQSIFGDVWSINLAEQEPLVWRKLETKGSRPSPRSRHTAYMIASNEWLIFGGKHGAFCYNCDLFTLNTHTLVWRKETVFRPQRTNKKQWWNAPEIIRQVPQLHCHSMTYDHERGILVIIGGCDGDGTAKDSTILIKRASTTPIVFEEWLLCSTPCRRGSLPGFIREHYDPYAFELLKYL